MVTTIGSVCGPNILVEVAEAVVSVGWDGRWIVVNETPASRIKVHILWRDG